MCVCVHSQFSLSEMDGYIKLNTLLKSFQTKTEIHLHV